MTISLQSFDDSLRRKLATEENGRNMEQPERAGQGAGSRASSGHRPAFRWGNFRLSAAQVDAFRHVLEPYADGSGSWSDDEVAEMAYELILFAATVVQIARDQKHRIVI